MPKQLHERAAHGPRDLNDSAEDWLAEDWIRGEYGAVEVKVALRVWAGRGAVREFSVAGVPVALRHVPKKRCPTIVEDVREKYGGDGRELHWVRLPCWVKITPNQADRDRLAAAMLVSEDA